MENLTNFILKANTLLSKYDDKDWNYSRIRLITRPLHTLADLYVLLPDEVDPSIPAGKNQIKTLLKEIAWGERHSNELGFLELVSLRVNRALLHVSGGADATEPIPIVRVVPRVHSEPIMDLEVLWYEVTEVIGEDFDSR